MITFAVARQLCLNQFVGADPSRVELVVPAVGGPSPIHGFGLIAREFVPRGADVWVLREDFDVVLPEDQLSSLSPTAQEAVLYYGCHDVRNKTYVLSSDDDRFTNHSDDPNTALRPDLRTTYALRDIYPDEEITWDYREDIRYFIGEEGLRNYFGKAEFLVCGPFLNHP